jgi:hypothetical protein
MVMATFWANANLVDNKKMNNNIKMDDKNFIFSFLYMNGVGN